MYPTIDLFLKPTGKGYDKWRGYKFHYNGLLYGDLLYDKTEAEVLETAKQHFLTLNV